MANLRMQACDVSLAEGKSVAATGTIKVTIPANVSGTGKSKRVTLDVSDAGRKKVEELRAAAETKTREAQAAAEAKAQEAWAPILRLKSAAQAAATAGRPAKAKKGSAPEASVSDDDHVSTEQAAEHAPTHEAPYEANPYEPQGDDAPSPAPLTD